MTKNWLSILEALVASGGLTPSGRDYAMSVASNPPSRVPSNSTRRNLIVDFASRKMGVTIPVESATLEAGNARILESEADCLGYFSQPEPVLVRSAGRNGQVRGSWVTFDFLVIRPDGVEIHECKPEAECVKLSETTPGRFRRNEDGTWAGPDVEAALREHGIRYRIVTEANVPALLLRNLAVLAEISDAQYTTPLAPAAIKTKVGSRREGTTLATLISGADGSYSKNDVYCQGTGW